MYLLVAPYNPGSNQDETENEDAKVDDIPETLENTILNESSDAEAELGGQSAKAKNHDKEV